MRILSKSTFFQAFHWQSWSLLPFCLSSYKLWGKGPIGKIEGNVFRTLWLHRSVDHILERVRIPCCNTKLFCWNEISAKIFSTGMKWSASAYMQLLDLWELLLKMPTARSSWVCTERTQSNQKVLQIREEFHLAPDCVNSVLFEAGVTRFFYRHTDQLVNYKTL